MGGGEQELEGAAGGEVAETLEVERGGVGGGADVARGGVGEGAGEAAIEDEQQVATGQVAQGLAKGGHGPIGGGVVTAGVGGQQEAGEVVLLVGMGQAVASEVEEEPVGRRLEGGKVVGQQEGEGGEGGLGVQEAEHLEALALQGVGDGGGVAHGIEEGRNAVGVGVDADDDGEAALEARQGYVGVRGLHGGSQRGQSGKGNLHANPGSCCPQSLDVFGSTRDEIVHQGGPRGRE